MLDVARSKLWTVFFVAILLFVAAGVFGPQVAQGLVMVGIFAYPRATNLAFRRRITIWLTAMTVGIITSIGFGLIGIKLLTLLRPGDAASVGRWIAQGAFWLAAAISLAPAMVAWRISRILIRRSSRRGQVAPPSAPERQVQRPDAGMTVIGEDVQNQGCTETNGSSALNLPSKRRTQLRVAGILVLLVAAGTVLVVWHTSLSPTSAAPQTDWAAFIDRDGVLPRPQVPSRPVAKLSIDSLLLEYRQNPFAAAAKYESPRDCFLGLQTDDCRVVEVAGAIRDMGRDDSGVAYIRLATSEQFVSVEARFLDTNAVKSLATLRRGQRVSVHCWVLYDSTTYRSSAGLLLTQCGVVP